MLKAHQLDCTNDSTNAEFPQLRVHRPISAKTGNCATSENCIKRTRSSYYFALHKQKCNQGITFHHHFYVKSMNCKTQDFPRGFQRYSWFAPPVFHQTNCFLKLVNWSHQSYFFYSIMSFYESFWEIKRQNLNAWVNYTLVHTYIYKSKL